MSAETERRLHDQLYALGTIEPSPGLADAALRLAKQRRRRGITVIAAAAAAVLAIAIAVPLSLRHTAAGPTTPPTGPVQRNVVVNYLSISQKNPDGILMVLDPKTGRYVESKLSREVKNRQAPYAFSSMVASPDGQHYATSDGTYVGSLTDVINGNVAGFQHLNPGRTTDLRVTWSADSSRLLIPIQGVNLNFALSGFRIYDVPTKRLGNLVHLSTLNVDNDRLLWTANETRIMGFVGQSDSAHQKAEYFDLEGKLQRSLTLPNHLDALEMTSPDGRYLALSNGLLDLQTGRHNAPQVPGGRPVVAPLPLGWLDDDHYAVDWKYTSGKTVEQRLLVLSNSGKLIKTITPPYGTSTMPNTEVKSTGIEIQLGYGADYPPHSGLRL